MTIRTMAIRAAVGAAMVAMVIACSGTGEPASKVPLAKAVADSAATSPHGNAGPMLSAAAQKALDSGNVLHRTGTALKEKNDAAGSRKLYEQALVQYRLAAKESPDHVAPWFGIQMVANEFGNKALVDSAFAAIRARNAVPSATGAQHDMSDSTLDKLRSKMKGAPPIS